MSTMNKQWLKELYKTPNITIDAHHHVFIYCKYVVHLILLKCKKHGQFLSPRA